jgi:cyclase
VILLLLTGAAQLVALSPGRALGSKSVSASSFSVQRLATGVYAVIREDPPGLMCDGNSVFIINDDDVVVVDAPEASKDLLAALRQLTTKPVKYVINTHWHDDHIIGNQVYRDAFPGVEFVGHAKLREYLPSAGLASRKNMLEGAPKFAAQLRSLVEKGRNLSGEPLTAEERASYESDVRLVDRYVAVVPGAEIVLPTVTFEDRLTLHRGSRTIEIRFLGRGHTSGDIIVHLPEEGIVITGDLVVWPIPLVGSDQSHVGDWAGTLGKIIGLRPTVLVPGHGPVMHDDVYVRLMADLMSFIKQKTEAAVSRDETLELARKSVSLDDFQKRFAGESRLKSFIFQTYVTGPAIESAFRDATTARTAVMKQ